MTCIGICTWEGREVPSEFLEQDFDVRTKVMGMSMGEQETERPTGRQGVTSASLCILPQILSHYSLLKDNEYSSPC